MIEDITGKARKIVIYTRTFDKAGDATEFFRAMLSKYNNGDRVSDDDALDLQALLKRHDEYDEKVGSGISHFYVDQAPDPIHPTRCFWISRVNETRVDFSYPHCLAKKSGE